MGRILPALLAALAAAAALAAGPEALGRLALRTGLPELAATLLETPRWRGVALYQAGRFAEADASFRRAGFGSTYNRGNSLAVTGNHELAVAYYDAVLYVNADDADAQANRAKVAALVEPVVGVGNEIDGIAAVAAAAEAPPSAGTYEMQIQALMRDRPRPPRPDDSRQSVAAGEQWLTALPDDPGRYLKLRIAAEQRRRLEAGAGVWQGGDPW